MTSVRGGYPLPRRPRLCDLRLTSRAAYIDREALLAQKAEGPIRRRLVQVRLEGADEAPMLYHYEPVFRDGEVGSVMSGAYGHRIASLGLAYVSHPEGVTKDWLESGRWGRWGSPSNASRPGWRVLALV